MKLTNWCMIVLLVLASCASPTGNIANNEPIHIGSILILSGEGKSMRKEESAVVLLVLITKMIKVIPRLH